MIIFRFEKERRDYMEQTQRQLRQQENRIAALDYENKDLVEKKHKNDNLNQRLQEQLEFTKNQVKNLQSEIESRKSEVDKIDSDSSKKDRIISQLNSR